MISRYSSFSIKNRMQLIMLLGFVLGLGGCATATPDMGVRADGSFEVPAYVRNLPKSRTGNMDQYTVFGKRYRPMDSAVNFSERGQASWYGDKFHGRKTSSGELYDMYAMTAAHKYLPLPTYVRVTNLDNNKSIVVLVNDRGPFVGDRIIDLSYAAAQALDMADQGIANVQLEGLSTHLVAENESLVDQNTTVQNPSILEPTLAAVPMPKPIAPLLAVPVLAAASVAREPNSNSADGVEDGFVELTEPLTAPMVREPVAVRSFGNSTENYFIQLGAFSSESNAQLLVNEVAGQVDWPTYVEQNTTRNLFRVKMGPFKDGVLLENTLAELAGLGIEGYTIQATSR